MNSSDREDKIWKALKEGKSEAITELIRTYHSDLYFFGIKITDNKELVEDCLQEIWIDLWEKRKKLSKVSAIKPYLLKTLRRRVIRKLQYQEKKNHWIGNFPDEILGFAFSVEEKIIAQQSQEVIQQKITNVLDKLSNRQKEVIYLRFYQELSYDEICEVMELKRQSMHNLLQEAFRSIKKQILIFILLIISFL